MKVPEAWLDGGAKEPSGREEPGGEKDVDGDDVEVRIDEVPAGGLAVG